MAVDIVQRPNSTRAKIRFLQPKDLLILFTPIIQPPPEGDARMDLFKPLGHALSEHYKRIRHVPYIPGTSITETHLAFLRRAGAVIIVVCNHPNTTSVKGNGYDYQRAFAQAALDEISSN